MSKVDVFIVGETCGKSTVLRKYLGLPPPKGSTKTHSTCNSSTGWNGLVYSPQQFCIEGNPSSSGACFHDGGAPGL